MDLFTIIILVACGMLLAFCVYFTSIKLTYIYAKKVIIRNSIKEYNREKERLDTIEKRLKIEEELYELAGCEPLDEEKLLKISNLQKEHRKLMKRICPLKQKVEFRFSADTTGFEISDAIEPIINMNPLHEGYIVKRIVEIIEYHNEKPHPYDTQVINENYELREPKSKKSA